MNVLLSQKVLRAACSSEPLLQDVIVLNGPYWCTDVARMRRDGIPTTLKIKASSSRALRLAQQAPDLEDHRPCSRLRACSRDPRC